MSDLGMIILNRKDIEKLQSFLTKFDYIDKFTLIKSGDVIGSLIHVEVEEKENGFNVTKKYEISGVENW